MRQSEMFYDGRDAVIFKLHSYGEKWGFYTDNGVLHTYDDPDAAWAAWLLINDNPPPLAPLGG